LLSLSLKRQVTRSLPHSWNEHQWSVNYFWSCILDNYQAVQWHLPIITVLAAFMGKNATNNIVTTFTPLVLQVYFWDHTGSLDNPNMDTQSRFTNCLSDFCIGSTFQISTNWLHLHYPTFASIDQRQRSRQMKVRCVSSLER